ncbi:transposase [Streptomyces mirabilis]|uniref:transposase n=1 Tax=Streptomyces mirabilis TaxID=68239 RepID=UPI0036C7B39A
MDLFDKNQDAATEPLPAGRRDACALTLAWYMAGRASEPAGLNIRDVAEDVAELVGPETGELLELPALVITLHRSKTNPHVRTTDVVRIVAQDDKTCPLAAAGVERGPLLRRVKNDELTTAGRPPRDPARTGGIGDRTIRNLIRDTAAAERAVRMYRTADPKPQIKKLAVDLGVHPEALRGWIRQAEADSGERDDRLTTDERAELAALRKENVQLKRANEVLRTASAFFAAQLDPTRPG